jgi:hypothetical protein
MSGCVSSQLPAKSDSGSSRLERSCRRQLGAIAVSYRLRAIHYPFFFSNSCMNDTRASTPSSGNAL